MFIQIATSANVGFASLAFCFFASALAAGPTTNADDDRGRTVAAAPAWIDPPAAVSAGYYSLNWNADAAGDPKAIFEIEEAGGPEFNDARVVYRGSETGTTLSGKANGTYYYRVRVANAISSERKWSATHSVVVAHHPPGRAFAFLILGATVFLATAVLILRGSAAEKRNGEDAESGAET